EIERTIVEILEQARAASAHCSNEHTSETALDTHTTSVASARSTNGDSPEAVVDARAITDGQFTTQDTTRTPFNQLVPMPVPPTISIDLPAAAERIADLTTRA